MLKPLSLSYAFIFILTPSVFANTPISQQITTSGQCIKEAPADRLSVQFSSRSENLELKKAQDQSKKKYEELRVALKALNFKDSKIETTAYNVNELKEWEKDRSVFKGYVVEMGLGLETSEIERAGEALAAASKVGITDVGNLQMFLSDAKKQALRFDCLDIAAKDAQKKAQRIAESLGVGLGKAQQVNEQSSFDGYYLSPRRHGKVMAMMDAEESAPQVENQSQRLSLTLNVSFGIK